MRSCALLLCLLMPTLGALGQESTTPAGFHQHDGFYLGLSLGTAYGNIDDKVSSISLNYEGWGSILDVRIGGTIADNLMLSGDIIGLGLSEPKITAANAGDIPSTGTTLYQTTFGAGLTYYFMPVNIFISGTVGFATFSFEKNSQSVDTDAGLGLYFKVGKEWWVGADWALGVAVSGGWASTETSTTLGNEKLSGYSIGIHFNATYN